MSNGIGLGGLLAIKRKIFVSYHHSGDQSYYDEFSFFCAYSWETIQDNSLDRRIDSDNHDFVIRNIRENYITGTSCTIVLCGSNTRWRKYVDWEIKASLDKEHGLIGVKLPNNLPDMYGGVHKPDRLQDNIDTGYALWTTWDSIRSNPNTLQQHIELANMKSKLLINNARPLRKRNGF